MIQIKDISFFSYRLKKEKPCKWIRKKAFFKLEKKITASWGEYHVLFIEQEHEHEQDLFTEAE